MNAKPTGNLEELFRHHLAEAEVPPRSMLWEQIDNSLLVAQNETYRRRLAATRWVAAASLLLATLAGAGWWAQHDAGVKDQLAANRREATAERRMGAESGGASKIDASKNGALQAGANSASQADTRVAATLASNPIETDSEAIGSQSTKIISSAAISRANLSAIRAAQAGQPTAANYSREPGARLGTARGWAAGASSSAEAGAKGLLTSRPGLGRLARAGALGTGSSSFTTPAYAATKPEAGRAFNGGGIDTGGITGMRNASVTTGAGNGASSASTMNSAVDFDLFGMLAARPVALQNAAVAPGTSGKLLALMPVSTDPTIEPLVRKWQFSASYAVGAFNPNLNFSRAGGAAEFDYNPALGTNSPALTETAAAEYREHLQSGPSQRIAVRTTRRISGHWALSTGVEVAQQKATSATSAVFLGEQIPDFGQTNASNDLRTSSFRYRTAGIPVELRYANSAKRGWSAYGRLGTVVSALLNVRAEVDGYPEATRTYSILSANDAYRKVVATARGGAGVQFRPTTGNWAFTLGPTAEVGLLSLNAHPAQDFLHQSRAYGFGLEAGVEFGK